MLEANDAAVADLEFARIKSAADKGAGQWGDLDSTTEAAKLAALRNAADSGVAAIERGECREFSSMNDLVAHLYQVAEQAILAVTSRSR